MLKKIVFFDTETTGLGDKDRLCQIAYKVDNHEYESLFKPPIPIHPDASAITGLTDAMLIDKEPFLESLMFSDITKLANQKNVIFVAHNAPFDIDMLARENIVITHYIDTLKIARALDPENKAENYKQEYLRKYYDLHVDNARAHDALGDVRVLEALYTKLAEIITDDNARLQNPLEEMLTIMQKPLLMKVLSFGKYKGRTLKEIVDEDSGYLEWLLTAKRTNDKTHPGDEDWIYTLSHYLGKEYIPSKK